MANATDISKLRVNGTDYNVKDAEARSGLDGKVDKVAGKGLSTEDFTSAEKTKLSGIAAGAEVNVQADWNVTDSSSDAFIKNKPVIPTDTNQKVKAGSITFDANDVVNFEGSGIVSVTGDATNDKITISASHQSVKTLDTTATTAQSINASEAIAGSGKVTLHKVSKTGSYNDLSDKPIFWATYGTTTGEEIAAAINAGQDVRVKYGTNIYGNPMLHSGEGRYYFSGLYGSYTRLVVTCSSTGKTWTNDTKAFLGGFQVDGTSRVVGTNNGYVNTINGDYDPTTNKLATASDIPTAVSELTNDRYVRYDTSSQGLTDTQKSNARTNIGAGTSNLALGTSSTTAAAGNHTYHYWTNNTYYYDSYSGEKNWRIITENVLADTLRWQASTVANEEYWDYDSSSWKTSSLDFSNLFDGNSGTSVSIPYAQRKFRFTMTAVTGWPTTTLICLEGSWFNAGTISKITGTDYYVILTIETRANASANWVVKTTANFTQDCMNKLAYCINALHTGDTLYRFTIELAPWANTTNSLSLRRLMILSNYSGNSLTPFTYGATGKVTAKNTLNATTLQEGGTNLSSKYLGISAKAADSDKLDGNDSSYYQKALPTTSTAGKVLKSTSTAGTVAWGDDANTTYTVASGDSNGQIKVTPSSGNAYNVNVKGLGSAAYKSTGTASGNVPVLDSNGKLDASILPAIAVSESFTADSQSAMLALAAQVGDICFRTDEEKTYILVKTPASTSANWKVLEHPADAVSSVNGKTGVVSIGLESSDTSSTGAIQYVEVVSFVDGTLNLTTKYLKLQ